MPNKFPVESIPDAAHLYRRILQKHYKNNDIEPAAFVLAGGMSCDWKEYSTAQQSIDRVENKKVRFAGVVYFVCGKLRFEYFDVRHTPSDNNKAHCTVSAEDSEENRIKLTRLYEKDWALKLASS